MGGEFDSQMFWQYEEVGILWREYKVLEKLVMNDEIVYQIAM